MIVFDLKCDNDHVFEAWFASSSAFDEQRRGGLVACPICASVTCEKAMMAPQIAAKGNRREVSDATRKAMIAALGAAQAKALEGSRWVGKRFAQEARAMHDGDRTTEVIHGQASLAEAKALIDDGISVAPLPLPITPPKALN